jgi:hypothetical protein
MVSIDFSTSFEGFSGFGFGTLRSGAGRRAPAGREALGLLDALEREEEVFGDLLSGEPEPPGPPDRRRVVVHRVAPAVAGVGLRRAAEEVHVVRTSSREQRTWVARSLA